MTKRATVDDYAGALTAVLLDCRDSYPRDRLDWVRDSKRIHQGAIERGLGFFTLDLPQHADALMRGLADGRLIFPALVPYGRRRWKDSPIPRLFSGLWLRIFNREGLLLEDADPTAIFFLLTLTSMWKKVEVECHQHRITAVYDEYFSIDDELPPASSVWDHPDYVEVARLGDLADLATPADLGGPQMLTEEVSSSLRNCQKAADYFAASLGFFEPEEVSGKHGPGAVSDAKWGACKHDFPSWPEKLEAIFPIMDHGVLNHGSSLEEQLPNTKWSPSGLDEPNSYLTDVPKTAKGPRLIAEEPVSGQWMQQGVADILRRRVQASPLGHAIDFFDQQPSRDDCLESSRHGQRATIDLSSASDRLSAYVVQRAFRRNITLLRMLVATRTRFVAQDTLRHRPSLIRIRKFASMGSALTFPVQSIVFAMICVGVGLTVEPTRSMRSLVKDVRVFGDDIIVPKSWVSLLEDTLSALKLKVNISKSFSEGNFRESCGIYAYRGYDVTPMRVRTPLGSTDGRSMRAWVDTTSNAFTKGLWRLSSWLERMSPQGFKPPAVDRRAAPLGLPTNSSGINPSLRKKWDVNTQTVVYEVPMLMHRLPRRRGLDGTNASAHLRSVSYKDRTSYEGLFVLELPKKFSWVDLPDGPRGISRPAVVRRARVPEHLLLEQYSGNGRE